MGWQVHYCSSPGESKWSPTYDCFLPPTGPIYLTTPGHKKRIPSFLDKHKNNHKKKGSTSSIITGSLTVMRMAQRDTNQSQTKINNREFKQLQPWRRQCKKKLVFMAKTTALHLHHDFWYIFDIHCMITTWNLLMRYFMEDVKIQGCIFLHYFLKPDEVLKNSTPWEITYIW